MAYCLGCCALLSAAFLLPAGLPQLVLIALGMFFGAGTVGPAGAMVANLTPPQLHGSAFGVLSLANNLLGLAPGPIVTGMLADAFGLRMALQLVPLVSLVAAGIFALARGSYQQDLQQLGLRADVA
jgi:MFS family permease